VTDENRGTAPVRASPGPDRLPGTRGALGTRRDRHVVRGDVWHRETLLADLP
jgi:hypothetical protein